MALVKYGGGITQMSGSIGGNTYARNRYGNYVRARTKPVNPNSARQVKVRSIIAELTERWYDALDAAQRLAWQTYADAVVMKNKLGESIKLSGFNHFIRSNASYLDAVAQYFDDAPTTLTLPDKDPAFAIAAAADTQLVSVTFNTELTWNSEPGAGMYLLDGQPQNVTRNFFKGPYRGINWLGGIQPPGNTSPQTHTGLFTLVEGQKIWCRARIVRVDGRVSEPFEAFCTITATAA
ncbi:hypothetical protein ES703_61563 [subsurface metagenome]